MKEQIFPLLKNFFYLTKQNMFKAIKKIKIFNLKFFNINKNNVRKFKNFFKT